MEGGERECSQGRDGGVKGGGKDGIREGRSAERQSAKERLGAGFFFLSGPRCPGRRYMREERRESICQHTSTYVNIRQHTSTYVNIRADLVVLADGAGERRG